MFAMLPAVLALGAALMPTTVSAHGVVRELRNDGKSYLGYEPWWTGNQWGKSDESAGWPQSNDDFGFVTPSEYGTSHIACGRDATAGKTSYTMAAGSNVDILWSEWPRGHKGPVLTYMARCPGDCTKAKAEELDFFKIDHKGLISGGQGADAQRWASDELVDNNSTWTVTIPQDLQAGGYVLRHELIAMHSADKDNGAQNYPSCFNIDVTGNGNTVPEGVKADELYQYKGAGIAVNIWWPTLSSYKIPGPKLCKIAAGFVANAFKA